MHTPTAEHIQGSSSYMVPKLLALAFVCFTFLLLLANVKLLLRVSQDQKTYDTLVDSQAPQLDMTVPTLTGYDVDGRPVRLEFGQGQPRTLILAMSPTCLACEENWANWQRLLKTNPEKVGRVVIADVSTNEPPLTKEYIATHHLEGRTVLAQVNADSIQQYRFQYTPQTILVSGTGKVEAVQTGLLTQGRFAQKAEGASPSAAD